MSRLPELLWRVLEEALLVFARVLMERLGHWLMDKLKKPVEVKGEAKGGDISSVEALKQPARQDAVCMRRSTPWSWQPHEYDDNGRCDCGEHKES